MNVSDKRSQKKPKPLFGLFRKNKPDPVVVPTPLGSGISSVPLHSVLSNQDPYAPPSLMRSPQQPKPSVSDPRMPLSPQFHHQRQQQQQKLQQRRPRSKSTSAQQQRSAEARLLTERENALNKLCSNEITSPAYSLKDSLSLLSPSGPTPPPIPLIPLCHQSPISPITPSSAPPVGGIRKFSSAHDLRKAAKLQQESIFQATDKIPVPKLNKDLSRSRSLNSSPRKQHQQQPGRQKRLPRKLQLPDSDDSDDDIPLGYLQSPISKPSSLLSDKEEDDDKDLVPIAVFTQQKYQKNEDEYQTAADKYKEKVKERLQLEDDDDDDDDDDIPISLAMLSPRERTKYHNNNRV